MSAEEIRTGRVFLDRPGLGMSRAGGGIEARFELGDEFLQGVDLAGQVSRPHSFSLERLFGGGLLALPLFDEDIQPQLRAPEQIEVARQVFVLGYDCLAHPLKVSEIAGQRIGLYPHIGKHGAERDGGAHGLQRVLRLDQKCWGRLMPYALQHSEDFDNHRAALIERFADENVLLVERLQARLGRIDTRLDRPHARSGVDELLIKRTPIITKCVDLPPQFRLAFCRLALSPSRGVELLIVQFEGVAISDGRCRGRPRRKSGRRWRKKRHRRLGDRGLNCAGRCFARRRLGERAAIRTERQRQSQGPSEREARIDPVRSAENHVVQE